MHQGLRSLSCGLAVLVRNVAIGPETEHPSCTARLRERRFRSSAEASCAFFAAASLPSGRSVRDTDRDTQYRCLLCSSNDLQCRPCSSMSLKVRAGAEVEISSLVAPATFPKYRSSLLAKRS